MTPHPTRSRPPPRLTNRRKRTTPSAGSRAIRLYRQKTTFSRRMASGERGTELSSLPVARTMPPPRRTHLPLAPQTRTLRSQPEAQSRIQAAMKRGLQTRDAEMALARMLGDLAVK